MSDEGSEPVLDHHSRLLAESLQGGGQFAAIPGENEEYLALAGYGENIGAEEAFNIFIRRWIDPRWWPHLMDSDDNEAEYVRRWIRRQNLAAAAPKARPNGEPTP